MPIYEYQCKKCGQFEVVQKITAPHLKRCPTCHGKVTKLISSTSFHLKGTGWYATDYARKDSKPKDSGSDSKESKAESKDSKSEKGSTAADTKPTETKSSKSETKASSSSETKASSSKEVAAA